MADDTFTIRDHEEIDDLVLSRTFVTAYKEFGAVEKVADAVRDAILAARLSTYSGQYVVQVTIRKVED